MERLRRNARLSAALRGVTAAVVGVILNLALWFALHVLFAETRPFELGGLRLEVPVPESLHGAALLITLVAALAVFRYRASVLTVLALTGSLGVVAALVEVVV
jgi:chromate transporter